MHNSTDLFAHRTKSGFHHFYPIREAVRMCGSGEVVAVRVVEDEEGPLYGWWDLEQLHHSMIYPALILLDMCFPEGIKGAEKAGRGRAVRLRVEERPTELPGPEQP